MKQNRCPWPANNLEMIEYHDREWGTPLFNDRKLFEFFYRSGFGNRYLSHNICFISLTFFRSSIVYLKKKNHTTIHRPYCFVSFICTFPIYSINFWS
ncbi:DNA-3-methyladenine glycosylase I [Patescibacteria group bacterium]|nr:DNA-3-methyladenine glycosylase I [Patescibacteria group bacterium]